MDRLSFMIMGEMLAVSVPVTTVWTSPGAPREVDAPMVAADPDSRRWLDAMTHQDRLDLGGRAVTQLLYGEPVRVVAEQGEWAAIIAAWQPCGGDPRGYPGWVPRAHLAAAPGDGSHEAVVVADSAIVGEVEATYATILPVLDDEPAGNVVAPTRGQAIGYVPGGARVGLPDGGARVGLPGGGHAVVGGPAWAIRETTDRSPESVDPRAAVREAGRFTGLPYLWAGMSAYGLDCSGLVHLAYRACGAIVPRDAQDQAAAATLIPRDVATTGDFYFFARPGRAIHHVAFALDDPARMLHAPGTGEAVADEPMKPERLDTITDFAGRFRR